MTDATSETHEFNAWVDTVSILVRERVGVDLVEADVDPALLVNCYGRGETAGYATSLAIHCAYDVPA